MQVRGSIVGSISACHADPVPRSRLVAGGWGCASSTTQELFGMSWNRTTTRNLQCHASACPAQQCGPPRMAESGREGWGAGDLQILGLAPPSWASAAAGAVCADYDPDMTRACNPRLRRRMPRHGGGMRPCGPFLIMWGAAFAHCLGADSDVGWNGQIDLTHRSHSSAGKSVRPIAIRYAVQARVGLL